MLRTDRIPALAVLCGVYGISDNDRKYYSLERAREVLGYEPRDNSADHDE